VIREGGTKSKLLTTAVNLIWENSYGAVSVDDICQRAGVNKGSFYYAFKSKSDLAIAALECHWDSKRASFDQIFSPLQPPLTRIQAYCDAVVSDQLAKHAKTGKFCGCPFCSLASEIGTQDESVRRKAEEMSERKVRYLESAIREAIAHGDIAERPVHETARTIYCFVIGMVLQAKIENSARPFEGMKAGVLRLLGVEEAVAS
jgi:TetR/AcrR family transcriptional repressor of nem operon